MNPIDNRIGSEGARFIADSLKINCTLTGLWLNSNELKDEGAKYLAEALKVTTSLQFLQINSKKRINFDLFRQSNHFYRRWLHSRSS